MQDWKQYQEVSAEYFRSLGMIACTDSSVQGVRTTHDIDVLVTSQYVGFDITWIVECKHWKKPVNKLHVLGLREIVADVGADRGILLSESGFQSGAAEAAKLTNIQLTSLADLAKNAGESVYAMRLRDLYDRTGICKDRYWDIPKQQRIKYDLRQDVGSYGYSGNQVIDMCLDLLTRAFRGDYPIRNESIEGFIRFGKDKYFESPQEIIELVQKEVEILEKKLNAYKEYESIV